MAERVLVTGGGGFLGRYIVEMLRERGDTVRSYSRRRYPELEALDVACLTGSLTDAEAVDRAVSGMDLVIHVAAMAGLWGKRDDFEAVNVRGTESVLAACRKHGVSRLVYTSSPSVVFGMADLEGVDESAPYPDRYYADYPATKAAAEQLVLAANGRDLATCALRPHLIWGPRDTHIVPLVVERARSGQLKQIGDGSNLVDLTYVENAARAHLQAADALAPGSAVAGKPYFIGDGEPVKLWAWVNELLRRLGHEPVRGSVPYPVAYGIASVLEWLHRALPLSGEPRLTRFAVANFARSHYFSHAAAERDFGYVPVVDNETGLERTVAWYGEARG